MQVRVLIHRQHGHPVRGLVREAKAIVLHPHGIRERPAAGNDQQPPLARHSPMTARTASRHPSWARSPPPIFTTV